MQEIQGLQAIHWPVGLDAHGQGSITQDAAVPRMHTIERWKVASGLDCHQVLRLRTLFGRKKLRNLFDGRRGDQRSQWKFYTKALMNSGHQSDGKKRVSSDLKEIIRDPDIFSPQNFAPYLEQIGLDWRTWRRHRDPLISDGLDFSQGLKIDFPVLIERQALQNEELRRHAIIG